MSFFIRKRQRGARSQPPGKLTDRVDKNTRGTRGGKRQKLDGSDRGRRPPQKHDPSEEITSEEDSETEVEVQQEHEVEETEQEVRLRLAKQSLEQLKSRVGEDELAEALKEQQLLERGSLLQHICTDEYGVKELKVGVLLKGGKVLKSPLTSTIVNPTTPSIIYVSTKSGHVLRFNSEDSTKTHVKLDSPVLHLACSTNHLAVSTTPAILLLNPTTLQTHHTFNASRNSTYLACSPDYLYSTHKDRTVKVWNLQEKAYVESLFGHQDTPTSVDVVPGPQQRIVSSGGWDRSLRTWKIEEESQLLYNFDADIIECVRVLNGGYFVAGSSTGDLGLFSFGRKKPLHLIHQAHGCTNGVGNCITSLGGTGDFVCSGSVSSLKVWRVKARKLEWVRDVDIGEGVVVGINVISSEGGVKLIVGVSYEYRNGRWGGKVGGNSCRVVVVE